ncbi:hypothetical protein HK098_001389 [Nowakowskiella sp. JEL0407]|nr:hypothetical protein HK098_001389 [Nowakowskiella sp. JEL0407]
MTSVLEFLNENFKSVTDLAKVDSLISEHQNELERLQQRVSKQAESYPKKLNESLKSTKQSKETLISIQSNKDKLLNLIDTYDVSIPSLSSESSDAKDLVRFLTEKYVLLERFAALHTYLRLLSLADELVEEIRTHNPNSIEKCLVSYQTICKIWTKLVIEEASALDILLESGKELPPWPSIKRLNDALTPNARTGLQSHIFGCITAVYSDITATLEEKLNMLLTKIKWPNQVKASEEFMTLKDDIKAVFRDLLSMNIPEKSGKLKRPVLPIQIMVKPIALRLKFHFDQPGKPTARLDKPEWIFQYVMNLIEEHNLFLQTQIQLIFESLGYQQINAKMEFIYALEQILSQKFRRDIPKLLSDANLFAHAVTESITFTKTLRDVHGYDVSKYLKENSNEGGVLSSFTDNDEWFSAWIDIETEAGKTRLAEIFDGRDCWNLSFESMTDIDELKLSIASDGFILLLDTISERYKMLPNILRRISFFSEVQLTLLDEYLKFIRGKVDNHANTFKPKITLEQRNDDVFLLSRYCSSLNHVCHTLRDWGEELFYLEMWETIKKGNTSSEQDGDTIFDSIISAYTDEYNRILSILVNDCDQEITESLWQYAKK